MITMKTTQPRPAVTRLLAPIGAIMLLLLFQAGAASAHTGFLDSTPADGARLETAPNQIVLTFGEAPLDQGLAMVAIGPDGSNTPLKPHVEGAKVIAPWPPADSSGVYRVSWRVVANDGHPVSGAIEFSIGPASSSARPQPPTPETASAAPEATGSQDSFPMWVLIPIGILVVILAAVAIRQMRRTPNE